MNLGKAKPDPPLHFPDWLAALAATGWPADQQAAVAATVRWYLNRHPEHRTVQDLLGHKDVATTQIYTHVMAKPGLGVRSPLDG